MNAPTTTKRGAAELLARWGRKSGAPLTVVFQVTDRCNYNCVHCYETHGKADELSLAEIDRILGEIAACGTLFLTLTGGEFFMRRDADDILRAARRRKFAVKLLTTGWFIDERRADLIRDLGSIQVDLSFYSGDPCVHDGITLVEGSWKRTVAAARRLRERGVIVVLKAPVMGANASGLTDVARAAGEMGCRFTFDPKVTGREDGDLGPTALRAGDEALRAFYSDEEMGIWSIVSEAYAAGVEVNRLDEAPCRAGHDVCGITPQGIMTACQSLPLPAGDLRRQSFAEVWRDSPGMRRVRDITWGSLEECNRCDVRAYCTRCHAMALLEDGELAGPSREACRHAVLLRDLLRERGVVSPSERALPPTMQPGARRVRPPALRVVG